MIRVTSGAGAVSASLPVLDVQETPNGTALRAIFTRGYIPQTADAQFYTSSTGAPTVVAAGNGVLVNRMASALNTTIGKLAPALNVPLDRNHLLSPVIIAGLRRFRRYTYSCIAWRTNLTALVQFSIGLRTQAGDVAFGGGGGTMGYELNSIAAVNAGRWTVKRRLVTAGAVTTLTDSGLDPTTPSVLQFQFTEGLVSQLVISIDGAPIFATAGAADLPFIARDTAGGGCVFLPSFMNGTSAGSAAGAIDYCGDSRFVVEEI